MLNSTHYVLLNPEWPLPFYGFLTRSRHCLPCMWNFACALEIAWLSLIVNLLQYVAVYLSVTDVCVLFEEMSNSSVHYQRADHKIIMWQE